MTGRTVAPAVRVHTLRLPTPWNRDTVGVTDAGEWLLGAIAWIVSAFIIGLIAIVVWMSFLPGLPGEPGYTILNYTDIIEEGVIFRALANSFWIGVGTVLVNLVFAVPMAWLVHRTDIPGKPVIITLVAVSILIPGFLKAMGWILVLSPEIGFANHLAIAVFGLTGAPFDIYGMGGVIFVQGLMLTPAMFFLISGSMIALDPSLEEAAQMNGANRWKTIVFVSMPLIWPAIFAGLIYNLMTAVTLYEIAALLLPGGTPVLSTELFFYVRSAGGTISLGYAAVYGVLMMAFAIVALWFYGRAIRNVHRYAVVTGKGYRPNLVELGRYKWLAVGFVAIYIALSEVMPLLMLVWMSLMPALAEFSPAAFKNMSFETYTTLWGQLGGWETVANTLILITVTPLAVVILSLVMSFVTVRSKLPARRIVDIAAMLPHVVPGITFGFSLIIVGILLSRFLALSLANTLAMIVFALVIYRIPYCTRVTNAALVQIHSEIEEAARICGAHTLQVMMRVIVPLIKSSLAYAALWIALLVLREVTIPLLLSSPSNVVLSVRIWTLWETGQYGIASALGVVMFVASATILVTVQMLFRSRGMFNVRGA